MSKIQIKRKEKAEKKEKITVERKEILEMAKNTLIMLAITLVAGGILGLVYENTKDTIAQRQADAKAAANAEVFAEAVSFSENILNKEEMETLFEEKDFSGVELGEVLEAKNSSDEVIGYVMEVISHGGYGGDIVFRIGIQIDGTTNGISITSISETPGLGMRASEVLAPQFKDKKSDNFEVTKTGAVIESQIDAISSATITSKAVVKGVNAAMCYFRNLPKGGVTNE